MAISERERRDIFNGFEATHGEEFANTIMELLPNQPADQLVTRTDMHAFGSELRGEMAELRGEMSELRGEMAELRSELRGEMAELRAEVRSDIARLDSAIATTGADLRDQVSLLRDHTTHMFAGAIAANAIALVGVLVV